MWLCELLNEKADVSPQVSYNKPVKEKTAKPSSAKIENSLLLLFVIILKGDNVYSDVLFYWQNSSLDGGISTMM